MRTRARFAFGFVAAWLTVQSSLVPRFAHADEPRASRAEELFRQGKTLLGERDYARACPLLAASFDLDPGTGVLLALAICHEGEGKLASASAEYKVAAERAKAEERADRERVARDRALSLEPRLSTLAVVPPPDARSSDDFVIRRSGVVLARDAWDAPVALDGGEYVIEASSSGKKTWRTNVSLAASGERRTVTIPALEDIALAVPSSNAAPPELEGRERERADQRREAGRKSEDGSRGLAPLQIVGIAALGSGAVGIGVGTVYAFRALDKYEDSNQHGCDGDVCEGQGKADRLSARSAGNTATVGFAVGATLAVGGTVLLLLGGSADDPPKRSAFPLRGAVVAKDGGAMLSIGGSL